MCTNKATNCGSLSLPRWSLPLVVVTRHHTTPCSSVCVVSGTAIYGAAWTVAYILLLHDVSLIRPPTLPNPHGEPVLSAGAPGALPRRRARS